MFQCPIVDSANYLDDHVNDGSGFPRGILNNLDAFSEHTASEHIIIIIIIVDLHPWRSRALTRIGLHHHGQRMHPRGTCPGHSGSPNPRYGLAGEPAF